MVDKGPRLPPREDRHLKEKGTPSKDGLLNALSLESQPIPGSVGPSRRFDSLVPVGSLDVQASPLIMDQKGGSQRAEIQQLVGENQRLSVTQVVLREELAAARQELGRFQQSKSSDTEKEQHFTITQVALRQELADSKQEVGRLQEALGALRTEKDQHIRALLEKDQHIRALLEKIAHMEADLKSTAVVKPEFDKVRFERDELMARVSHLTGEVRRIPFKDQEITSLKSELDELHQRFQQARMDFEAQKKTNYELMELKHAAEKNAYAMTREMERLRADLTNAERRAYAATLTSSGNAASQAMHNSMPQLAYEKNYGSQQETLKGEDRLSKSADPSGDWSKHAAPNGKAYYHNATTGTSQWNKPSHPRVGGQPPQNLSPELTGVQPSVEMQQSEHLQAQMGNGGINLMVQGLSEGVSDDELARIFQPHGAVLYAKVETDKKLGPGHYYGIVTMESSQAAEVAVGAVNKTMIKGRQIKVDIEKPREQGAYHHQLGGYPHPQMMPPNMAHRQGGIGPIRYNRGGPPAGHWPY